PPQGSALQHGFTHLLDGDASCRGLPLDYTVDAVALDGTRCDAIHADVVGRQFKRHAIGHADLPGLGRTVTDTVWQASAPCAGGDMDDWSASRLEHLGSGKTHAEVRARQTRVNRVAPVLHRIVLDRFGRSGIARVIYQRV